MSAVEEIEAAIGTLEAQRGAATTGGWVLNQYHDVVQSRDVALQTGTHEYERDGIVQMIHIRDADADLIVTLHRTIDAQLAILRHAATHYRGDIGIGINRHVVALARAINGTA